LIYYTIIVFKEAGFMEKDKEMAETLEQDFSVLNEENKKKIVEMTKFLVLTQNTIVPGFLEEKSPVDMSNKERKKIKGEVDEK
jgi:hypothetical protein